MATRKNTSEAEGQGPLVTARFPPELKKNFAAWCKDEDLSFSQGLRLAAKLLLREGRPTYGSGNGDSK